MDVYSKLTGIDAGEALSRYAPEVSEVLYRMIFSSTGVLDAQVRSTCAEALSLRALPLPPTTGSARESVALDFAEQFSVDVSNVDSSLRGALLNELGSQAKEFVFAVYVADWFPRLLHALDLLFRPSTMQWPPPQDWRETELSVDSAEFSRSVARLRVLDPVTTELVRLRQARQHNCRLCKSLRMSSALEAGADEALFDEVDNYQDSGLSDRHKAALALADAMVWQPGYIPAHVISEVHEHFSPAEAVELVLDMTRNASSKVAVAFGSDAPHVDEGVEIYEVDEDGQVTFGLGFRA
ncbi:MAG: carboxymuconolactone decarboxylase family protein [Rhodococcus sp. (in: high G+C Gram-positive bacteria)]|uniref:carboxymuconolactone decarboxylase family protein n=1 Tax=Rhodococcus sp. TaxID=1831 RepID=UPI00122AFE8F|nr:carboxymuconolactone decarboxylase family protein [Rhodococcus sp. (in: high G+C Gram-positive bacteria)]RZL21393.1 MAG: carboxymuconolactone decarboxylase family protein [Rhodococcus sp. (in: high G+C Gram-positive bacteria)]